MKTLLLLSVFVTTSSFAQALDVKALKTLLTQKQTILEKVTVGMSKQTVTTAQVKVGTDVCKYTLTSTQTIVRLENNGKMIVFAQESFDPEASAACTEAHYEVAKENILFFENKPSLTKSLAEVDAVAADILSLAKKGEEVTMSINSTVTNEDGTTAKEKVEVIYDLSQSSFRNLKSTVGSDFKMLTTVQKDIDVNTLNLTDVLFCDSAESDKGNCTRGDFSDVLY